MKKWRALHSALTVGKKEIIREMETQIIFNENGFEQREAKRSGYCSWHDTKEEAKAYMISLEQKEIEKYLIWVRARRNNIKKIENL